MEWIINNKEWIFSGIGVFIISLLLTKLFKKSHIQKQKSGKNSTNYQASGDINIKNK